MVSTPFWATKNKHCLSLRGLSSLDPYQISAMDPLGGGLQQHPGPQLSLAMIFRHCMLCLQHNFLKTGNFSFFILGLGFWIISMLGTEIRTPPPPPPPLQDPLTYLQMNYVFTILFDFREIKHNLWLVSLI